MLPTHAVGIDLGTTYSCIAYLNDHGEPVTIPNRDGELCTPSVVMFDGNHVVVGTEALRNSVRMPDRVVMHAKRKMGELNHRWNIGGRSYSPIDISSLILQQLLLDAKERIGNVERAVITVPAQFSDVHRQATAEAGRRAGLKHVDIINEPVAAALCFVLGTEGIWFTELAKDLTIMVADLGGGTFDLSLVRYEKNSVRVVASGGDLYLGGLDWNNRLEKAISKQFQQEFGVDVAADRESKQALMLEVEQAKRSLSVRPKAALSCQAGGQRKTYQVELEQFERLTKSLVDQMETLTQGLLAEKKMKWAMVDVVLTTGGASRMPMVRKMLKTAAGYKTINTSLSPDLSIAHGATYYAGMLLANNVFAKSILNEQAAARLKQFKQQSVNARALGILVRDDATGGRVPHYLLEAHTQLPAEAKQMVGTVVPNQRRAHLFVVESGTASDAQYVELGTCVVDPLPEGLPEGSEIEVTIRYDEQARVHVSAREMRTGQIAEAEIVRPENLMVSTLSETSRDADIAVKGQPGHKPILSPATIVKPVSQAPAPDDEAFDEPIPLCDDCGEALDNRGKCPQCQPASGQARRPVADARPKARGVPAPAAAPVRKPAARSMPALPSDDEIIELNPPPVARPKPAGPQPTKPKVKPPPLANPPPRAQAEKAGEEEFWKLPNPKKKK